MRAFTRLSLFVGVAVVAQSAMAATKYIAADDSMETRVCVSAGECFDFCVTGFIIYPTGEHYEASSTRQYRING
jgi:hypothetical protein